MSIDSNSSLKRTPLYRVVEAQLLSELQEGKYQVGSQMPTEMELCKRFNVCRHTVREAIKSLTRQGLVVRRQGSGTVVKATTPQQVFVQAFESIDDVLKYVSGTSVDVIRSDEIPGHQIEVEGLNAQQNWRRLEVVRKDLEDQKTISWSELYLNPNYSPDVAGIGVLPPNSPLLNGRPVVQEIAEIQKDISIVAAPQQAAEILGLKAGDHLLQVTRSYINGQDDVLEASRSYFLPNTYTYSIRLHRPE